MSIMQRDLTIYNKESEKLYQIRGAKISNNYKIKYSSMDQFLVEAITRAGEWDTQLNSWEASFKDIIKMESFKGKSATAVKLYLSEVHEVLLQSIRVAISRFQSDYLLYKNQYYNIYLLRCYNFILPHQKYNK